MNYLNFMLRISVLLSGLYAGSMLAIAACEIGGYPSYASWKVAMYFVAILIAIGIFISVLITSYWSLVGHGTAMLFAADAIFNKPVIPHGIVIIAIILSGITVILALHQRPEFTKEGA